MSSKKNKSPLRYPGGKTRAIRILEKYVLGYKERKTLISPFFGGGSFELYMHSQGWNIRANDLFKPLYTFWKVLQKDSSKLVEKIRSKMPVTKQSFAEMRKTVCTEEDEYDMASSYFIINRCSFSGATLCGGFSSQAASGRLTESSLDRLVSCNLDDIPFSNSDFSEFLESNPENSDSVVYADPPYYIETYIYGKDGDMHEKFDHEKFAEIILKRKDWVISYNDCEYIRNLYKNCRIFKESWSYGMNASKASSEIIILPA